ncbi:MAG TPA: YcnI family protein [Pseudonocardiaceae bacterium]|nr:YcnI family protein [Pseudonocardiaceae bacterium]
MASAHVSAHSPDNPQKGGDAEIVFRVPNEEDTANTVKVRVNFSTTSPLSNAAIKPVVGWTAQETMMTLAKPVKMSGQTITKAVQSITWTAPAGGGIVPGQFEEFSIAVESLPDNTDALLMPAVQTYSNGDVVNWNQPTVAGKAEPEHPTPSLTLAAADSSAPTPAATSASSSDSTARWLGGAGIVVAAIALGFGIGAVTRGRRSASTAATHAGDGARQESGV